MLFGLLEKMNITKLWSESDQFQTPENSALCSIENLPPMVTSINYRERVWWMTASASHLLGMSGSSSASLSGRCQQIWLMSASSTKLCVCLLPFLSVSSTLTNLACLTPSLSCSIYSLWWTRAFMFSIYWNSWWQGFLLSPLSVTRTQWYLTHRHPVIDWIFILYNKT